MQIRVFHTLDSIKPFICYAGDTSGTNGDEINSVLMCGGFTHFQPNMQWVISYYLSCMYVVHVYVCMCVHAVKYGVVSCLCASLCGYIFMSCNI